ncbi:MFS transporter [Pseudomonas sp. RIT-To-2]|uniref:MFS transporter n=1 Tax=Pseudomonas sp. RIT-To-2 TaxID=3462541 RepID=UPI0024139278
MSANIFTRGRAQNGNDRRLLKLQFSFLLMVLGGRFSQLAVAWWALQETGSAIFFANIITCSITAEVIAKPMLGWLGDKYNKIVIIKIASLISLLTTAAMFALSATANFNPWTVGLLMTINSAVVGLRVPLQASVISLFADNEKVTLAFQTKNMMSSLSTLLGPAIASGLIYMLGVTGAFAADFIVVIIASLLIFGIPSNIGDTCEDSVVTKISGFNMIYSGFKVVCGVKVEFYLALVAMLINFALFPFFTILLPLYVKEVVHGPVTYIGLLDSSFGLGILVGSYKVVGWLSTRVPRDICVSAGFSLLGINILVVGIGIWPLTLPVAFFCGGIGLMLINIPTSAVRLLATPKSHRNRIFAIVAFLSAAASPIGSSLINFLVSNFGVASSVTILGTMVLATSLLVLLIPDFKLFMRAKDANLKDAYFTRYPSAFRD